MQEKTIEKKLADAVKARGGLAPKFTSPGFDGMPDRIVLMPGGRIAFCRGQGSRQGTAPFAGSETPIAAAAWLSRLRAG